jgi:hypothetical protein
LIIFYQIFFIVKLVKMFANQLFILFLLPATILSFGIAARASIIRSSRSRRAERRERKQNIALELTRKRNYVDALFRSECPNLSPYSPYIQNTTQARDLWDFHYKPLNEKNRTTFFIFMFLFCIYLFCTALFAPF